ncbi:hypothetical protein BV20DRAFT_218982 [Pilatotrama ljubarskyi]|nr:hypothetical protein BV20DRAFT_218982 [Pilatotrama ljubarskyi]
MSDIPNTLWTWNWTPSASVGSMNIPLAIEALVQNQLDQVLHEAHRRDWSDWTHEDLRKLPSASRKVRKQIMLKEYPGLLSGPVAVTLHEDVWLPAYVLSITIPRFLLAESTHQTDLRICDVIWEHNSSGTLSITLFNNHLDVASSFRHVVSEGESTKRLSKWAVGRKGCGFLRVARVLMTELRASQKKTGTSLVCRFALRVGHSTGEFGWGEPKDGQPALMLRQLDLHPLSLQQVNEQPGFVFPFDQEASTAIRELSKERRVSAIYRQRFLLRLSEKAVSDARATEPSHERSFVQSDEVLVTVLGLEPTCTPEYLFQGVWGVFPCQKQWTVPPKARNLPEFTFYLPEVNHTTGTACSSGGPKPCFYLRGFLVPSGLPLNRVGVNYPGYLDLSADAQRVITTGAHFGAYLHHLSLALDAAMRTMPDLAVELAVDILTDAKAPPHSFARVLSPSQPTNEEEKVAYRTAFQTAWCRLNPSLVQSLHAIYPYVPGAPSNEEELIKYFKRHPLPVERHVRELLEKTGAYPPIGHYAESLLLSAPGASQAPPGTDRLRAALAALFPALDGDVLSVRRYEPSQPRAVWDAEARTFVVSASSACEHQAQDGAEPCLCWIGPALLEAVSNWRSKRDAQTTDLSEAAVFHALLRCTYPGTPAANGEHGTSSSSNDSSSKSALSTAEADIADNGELEYADPPSPLPANGALGAGFTPRAQVSPSHSYPSPMSPSLPHRRGRGRSSVFVITPLVSKDKSNNRPSAQISITSPEVDIVGPSDALTNSKAAVSPDHPANMQDITDMADIWDDARKRVDARVQAMSSYYSREVSALQEQLSQAQSRVSELESTLVTVREEHAAVLVTKEEALVARDLALESKDDMLRERDVQIGRLKESLGVQTRRAKAAEGEVRRLEVRDRRKSARLRADMEELEKIQRRLLSDMLRAKSVQGEQGVGDDDAEDLGEGGEEGRGGPEGEPGAKRKRLR